MPTKPLNVLWISFEDTSPRLGCYGDDVAQTPNVDRLAAEGCRYPNTFSTAPVCAPARSAIITGMYATFTGAHHMRTTHRNRATPEMATPYDCVPPHYVRCFTEYFRAAGYYCTNNGKTDYQFTAPSTAWDVDGPTPELEGNHWRNRADPDQPFFAVFNLAWTHESGQWSEKGGEPKTDPQSVTLPPYLPDTLETRKALARQYDHIAKQDVMVGTLLRQLEDDGMADNTIVVFWSDHGEGLPRAKRWPYDAGIRVPLIVRWPGEVEPRGVSDRLISTIDLGPTMLSVCGLPIPAHLQGRAFLGPADAGERPFAFATRDRFDESYDMVRAVRDRRFKYIRNYRPELPRLLWLPYRNRHPAIKELWRLECEGKLPEAQRVMLETTRPPEELYDTDADPWELNNLADDPDHAETLGRLRAALDDWRRDYDRYGDTDEAQMKATWWRGQDQPPTTATPRFVPIHHDESGREVLHGGAFNGPLFVQLHAPTQGASLSWTDEPGDDARWRLYTGPIRLDAGTHTLRAKAERIGFKPSDVARARFAVE